MEKIYPASKYASSKRIPLKDVLEKYSKLCSLKDMPDIENLKSRVKDEITCNLRFINTKNQRSNIIRNTSISLLNDDDDDDDEEIKESENLGQNNINSPKITESAMKLETIQTRKYYKEKFGNFFSRDRYHNYCFNTNKEINVKDDIEVGSEFIVAIRVYYQFHFNYGHRNSYQNLKFSHEIIALGSNTLAELRDRITCFMDLGLCTEVDDPTKDIKLSDSKAHYPSGFIFIDDVFYNDMRNQNSIDYSEVIRKWAQDKQLGNLEAKNMNDVKINELTPRFGYPYLYQHQGRCEHIIIFSDAWIVSRNDNLKSANYPAYSSFHRSYSKICTICYVETARWICVDSDRVPHSKTFLCQRCLLSYNYKDGKKIGDFKVYPFFDRSYVV